MAAEYLRHRAARKGLPHLVVDSAGTLGIDGAPPSAEAVRTLRESGLELSGHRSKGLASSDVRSSDLIVGMAAEHLEHVAAIYPEAPGERWLLRAFERSSRPEPGARELRDPIGQAIEVYREQFGLIRTCVDHLVLYLRHLVPGLSGD
jgi:protein-tyrosine phosphatase